MSALFILLVRITFMCCVNRFFHTCIPIDTPTCEHKHNTDVFVLPSFVYSLKETYST